MIEAIKEIGEYVLEKEGRDKFLENICIKVSPEKTNGKQEEVKQHVCILNFDTKNQKIICDFEAVKEDTGRKYLWLGTARGNKPQIYFTFGQNNPLDKQESRKIAYLFSGKNLEAILNQKQLENSLKNKINKIKQLFYKEPDGIYRINPEKFAFFDNEFNVE